MNDLIHRKRARRIFGILKKSVSWELDTEREGSTFGTRRGQMNLSATGAARDGVGGRWKSQHRKIVPLFLCQNLLLKGNERFRTWTKKSLGVFRVSGFLFSMYICYNILCTFPIFMYRYVTFWHQPGAFNYPKIGQRELTASKMKKQNKN